MHEDQVALRPARQADARVIADYNIAMALETEGKVLDAGIVQKGVDAVLADQAKGFYLLAESGGRVVGQAMVTFEWSDWRDGVFWWLESVYVLPDFRRRGVFAGLFRALEAGARARPEVVGLRLYVDQENKVAQETYRHLGMATSNYALFELEFEG
ncbi:ribosomal protein S18 acetylase RimI-like enzyme [Methanofollis sp. W23]|uniref:GNAT family N-acetyltransferase n=1 Tax=Methanofollis sp. W23 TaxID=2817849 RepID=UPI001AE55695|nr:GNAT family N-acetyltransferase [Methanofollis sp. W23]MBP2146681.1 ribosomal protein S18 acetylase RimI-like enzyme [Methanofollis sp. W23]